MTQIVRLNSTISSDARIAGIIEEFGAWRVLRQAIRALLRTRRRASVGPEGFSNHLRRDIGLAPETEALRYWDLG
ncbi:MAG: hypothetical protein AAGB18_01215 [Pseudomonadota bacterium]